MEISGQRFIRQGITHADDSRPNIPWGLVFSSHDNFDADYCWYPSLQEAYKESRLVEEFADRRQKG